MEAIAPRTRARVKACHCCGLVQELPPLAERERALCRRCGVVVDRGGRGARSNPEAAAAALAGLILYPLAVGLPIMRIEEMGRLTEASVWSGTLAMLRDGDLLVGSVVFLCSVVIPLFKLVGLLLLSSGRLPLGRRQQAWTWRLIEWTGRWGMLDVLLIALVVAWIKVGGLVQVQAGPAALTFTLVVLLSLLAAARFDPHALWERQPSPTSRA